MELVKKNIHMNRQKGREVSQIHLDEDQNVPDRKADVEKVIWEKSEIRVEEVRPAADHVFIRGVVCFDILYMDHERSQQMHSMHGRLPFEDTIQMEGVAPQDNLCVEWELLQPAVTVINSRKINFRAVITLTVTLEEVYDEDITVDLYEAPQMFQKKQTASLLQMKVSKKDILRIRNQWQLPADKPNIGEILFYTVTAKGVRIRCLENRLLVQGTFLIFALYQGEPEGSAPAYCSYEIPFEETLDCSNCQENMISHIPWDLGMHELEIKPDSDGELRVLSFEGVLELSIKLYEEEEVEGIVDVYSVAQEVKPQIKMTQFTRLLVKNETECRTAKRMKIADTSARVLQICHSDGSVQLKQTEPVEKGLKAEGEIAISVLYITADDMQPLRLAKGTIPFSQVIDMPNLSASSSGDGYLYHVVPSLEQLSVQMMDSEEMEIKAVIRMDAIVFDKHEEPVLTDIICMPMDYEKLNQLPGMVGYRVCPGDDLWTIAKANYTTTEKLMQINGLKDEQLRPGMQLIVLKELPAMQ